MTDRSADIWGALKAVQHWDEHESNPASYGGLPKRIRAVVDAALTGDAAQPSLPNREAIAKIINPRAFKDDPSDPDGWLRFRDFALVTADAIIALAAQPPAAPVDNQSLAQAMYAEGYAAAKAELAPAAPVETKEPEFDPSEWEQIIEDREDALQRSSAGSARAILNQIEEALYGDSEDRRDEALDAAHVEIQRLMPTEPQRGPDDIRAAGWAVAVHNDYRLNGEAHTFWLFTKEGHAVKGEGRTDAEALDQVRSALALSRPHGGGE